MSSKSQVRTTASTLVGVNVATNFINNQNNATIAPSQFVQNSQTL